MTDESIIDLYFARDSMAIHYSQEQYGNLCHAVASNILPTLEDAQECVNDTWLKAWNSIPPTRPKHLGAYLSRITRNLSLERWRTIHAQKRGGNSGTVPLDELAECLSGGEDPADTESAQFFFHATGIAPQCGRLRSISAFLRAVLKRCSFVRGKNCGRIWKRRACCESNRPCACYERRD